MKTSSRLQPGVLNKYRLITSRLLAGFKYIKPCYTHTSETTSTSPGQQKTGFGFFKISQKLNSRILYLKNRKKFKLLFWQFMFSQNIFIFWLICLQICVYPILPKRLKVQHRTGLMSKNWFRVNFHGKGVMVHFLLVLHNWKL